MTTPIAIDQIICDFVTKGVSTLHIHVLDQIYTLNKLLTLLQKEHYDIETTPSIPLPSMLESMDRMVDYAVAEGLVGDTVREREEFEALIMDLITPSPSEVNRDFWEAYQEAPLRATQEFYDLCRENDYIKTRQIARNEHFTYESSYGRLDITINLSKPEKTVKDIEAALEDSGDYPQCALCAENEGYKGRAGSAARSNHRVIRIPLNGENWGFQYSPYAYYNEHCIVFTRRHIPMNVTKLTIANLLELVTVLPHYFMGTNAGLPIVGGSLLGHEHFQGGRHNFPMEKAQVVESWDWHGDGAVQAERLHWPLSVIRLRSLDAKLLLEAGSELMEAWSQYTNEELAILAESEAGRHNAVTLIARRAGEAYELDVVLRNNRVTAEHPEGIFHPHRDVQHIKKENIGLIEVLGLAILPPRLKEELEEVRAYLLGNGTTVADYHQEWAEELKQRADLSEENVDAVIREAVGRKFQRVLEDAGVFKQDEQGQEAFRKFVASFQGVSEGETVTEK